MSEPTPELVEIRIIGMPLDVYQRSGEHHDGLLREFALLAAADDPGEHVPARLVALAEEASWGPGRRRRA